MESANFYQEASRHSCQDIQKAGDVKLHDEWTSFRLIMFTVRLEHLNTRVYLVVRMLCSSS
jgi:hypothetical protein